MHKSDNSMLRRYSGHTVKRLSAPIFVLFAFVASAAPERVVADESVGSESTRTMTETRNDYQIQPGDVLTVSVWKEPDLQADVLVRPDGGLSFPLVGDLQASHRSVHELTQVLTDDLKKFIPDPVVTVAVKAASGSRIYVLGKVSHPGEFPLYRPLDVMQALSLAGGTTPFAALNDIEVLRRDGAHQQALPFRYGDVENGRKLEQNFLLQSGDTVVVP